MEGQVLARVVVGRVPLVRQGIVSLQERNEALTLRRVRSLHPGRIEKGLRQVQILDQRRVFRSSLYRSGLPLQVPLSNYGRPGSHAPKLFGKRLYARRQAIPIRPHTVAVAVLPTENGGRLGAQTELDTKAFRKSMPSAARRLFSGNGLVRERAFVGTERLRSGVVAEDKDNVRPSPGFHVGPGAGSSAQHRRDEENRKQAGREDVQRSHL